MSESEPAVDSPCDVTRLLHEWRDGDRSARERLFPLVYDQLHAVASKQMRRERASHTLQPTALVHEAYLRLVGDKGSPNWQDRVHFLAIASTVMRRVLVDHARQRAAEKRGAGAVVLPLDEALDSPAGDQGVDVLALHHALEQLSVIDSRQAKIVELRFFGGLTLQETADILGVSVPLIVVESRLARAWLYRFLQGNGSST
jgi:RNA polymerase sigma factor (TIGR02999 family)